MTPLVLYVPDQERPEVAKKLFAPIRGGQVPSWWYVRFAGGKDIWMPRDPTGRFAIMDQALVLHDPEDRLAGLVGCLVMSEIFGLSCFEGSWQAWPEVLREHPYGGQIIFVDPRTGLEVSRG